YPNPYKGIAPKGKDTSIIMQFLLALFCVAAVALAAPTGEEKDHIWITKISHEGKKAIKEVILNEKQDPIEKWAVIDKIVQSEGEDVKKAYTEAHERLKAKFEEKKEKFHELSAKLSPAAQTAVKEVIAVFKGAGSPFTKAPKIKEIIEKQTSEVKKEIETACRELFPNAEKIKDFILSKLGGH
ncbi:hypothetical protein PENTCL1PPCAC_6988, partial [Pristionchus entomophagus]